MKLNNFKKQNQVFDPATHWAYLMSALICIALVIALYGAYSYFYIQNQIVLIGQEAQLNVQNSTSTDFQEKAKQNQKLSKNINDLNATLEAFNAKEETYTAILKNAKTVTIIATTTASSSVATSSNQ